MNTIFKTATDFRKSLEARLQVISKKTNVDLQRLRRKVAFDRLLARIFSQEKGVVAQMLASQVPKEKSRQTNPP